jgi:Ig-like domain CHU_C associated
MKKNLYNIVSPLAKTKREQMYSAETRSSHSANSRKGFSFYNKLVLLSLFVAIGSFSSFLAQVTVSGGSGATAGSPYGTLAAAITAINGGGAFTGPVTVNVAAGHTETLTGAIILTETGTSANPLTIQKSGAGANPVLLSYVGIINGNATAYDAMFILAGSDYVTINGIDLNSLSGTNATTGMEVGYMLTKASATNGAQNNTIMNCTISMNHAYVSYGVAIVNATAASFVALDPTTASGTNSNNTIKSNNFIGSSVSIWMRSFSAPAPYTLADVGNVVGGNSLADGNTITNFSGQGMFINNQWGYLVKYNTINNTDPAFTGTTASGALRGIFCNISGAGASGEVSYNDIQLKYQGVTTGTTISATSTAQVVGIEMKTSNTAGTAGNTIIVNNNKIHNCSYTNSTATIPFGGIVVATLASNVQINNNEITNISFTATPTAITVYGILNLLAIPTSLSINNNNIHDIANLNTIGTINCVLNSTTTANYSFSNNIIDNISRTSGNAGAMYGYINSSAPTAGTSLIRNNTITNMQNGTGLLSGISKTSGTSHISRTNLNTVQFLETNGTFVLTGITHNTGAAGSSADSNVVNNLENIGTGATHGIQQTGTTATMNSSQNEIHTISSAGNVYGMFAAGTLRNIFNNKIYGISSSTTTSTSNGAYGIYLTTSTNMNVYNNMIYDISANASENLTAVNGIYVNAGTNVNIVHNTINPTSVTPFVGGVNGGATGVYMIASANGVIDNNIIYLTEGGGLTGNGLVTAIKRSSGSAGVPPVNLSMKGNILWAPYIYSEGSSSASAVNIFHTGAGAFGTADPVFNTPCGLFKTFMAGGAAGSFSEDNLNFSGGVFVPAGASFAESGAIATTPNPATDFLGTVRGVPADMGAVEFAGTATDAAAPIIVYSALPGQSCTNNPVISSTITDFTGVNTTAGSKPRVYFKKSTESNVYSPASPNNSTYNGWKYVEATGTAPNFSLTINYSLLTSPVAAGETINYFVVAQDVLATPNVGANVAILQAGVCPTSVNLPAAAFPVSGFASFNLLNPSTMTVTASPLTVCTGNDVTLVANVINAGTAAVGAFTTTSSTASPYNGSATTGRRVQFIFTPAELNSAGINPGAITSMAFDVTSTSGYQNLPDMIIRMGHTTTSVATTAFLTDPTSVVVDYTGVGGYTPAQGLNTHTFTSPFVWDGTSNLLIDICHGSIPTTATIVLRAQTTPSARVTHTTNVAGCAYTGTGSTTTLRSWITFGAQVGVSNLYSFAWSNGVAPVGTNNDTIVAQPTFPTGPVTYSVIATDANGCTASGNVVVTQNTTTPTGTASADNSTICIGNTVNLSSTALSGCPPYTYSWSNGASVVSTLANFAANPTVNTTYTLTITDNASQTFTPPSVVVTVNNPLVLTTTPGSRCGTGTVNLGATGSGIDMVWYANATGGIPLGNGNAFTTPIISSTTDFYVAASSGSSVTPIIPGNTPTQYTTAGQFQTTLLASANMQLNVVQNLTLATAEIYPSAALGTAFTVECRQGTTSGPIVASFSGVTTVQNSGTPTVAQLLNLNFNLAPGTYYIGFSVANPNCWRSGVFTHPVASWNIPGVVDMLYSLTPSYQYYFYNPIVTIGCESARTAVTATVTPPPALTISAPTSTICENSSTGSVNVTSTLSDFDTYVWTPSGTVTGTTSATFNPVVNTSYTLTATNTSTGCANTITHDVIVNPAPPLAVSATPNPVCDGENVVLFANSVPTIPYSMNPAGTATYIDIDPTGTSVGTVGDDTEHNITIPSFLFNGVSYTTARVGMNGAIALGSTTGEISVTNAALPSTTNSAGNVLLAPWWDDLDIQTAASIKTETVGNMHIIQFTDAAHNNFTTAPIEFQVQLNLTSGEIHFVYPDVIFGSATYDAGISATVGIQFSGTSALQYSFNTASLTNNQTITFTPLSNTLAWSGPSSFTSTVASNTLTGVTLANAGTYTVIATGSNGCTKTQSVTLVVNQTTSSTTTASHPTSYTWSANGTTYTTSGTYTHTLVNAAGCDSNLTLNLTIGQAQLNVTVFIEGYYIPASSPAAMVAAKYDNLLNAGSPTPGNPTDVSNVTIELWPNASGATYTATAILNTSGLVSVIFPAAAIGGTYWIAVTSPNTLRTFSAGSIVLGGSGSYNFSNSLASAATDGSATPMATLVPGSLFGVRSGDINQDEFIDGTDYSVFELDVNNSANGNYSLPSDLNGDTFVDGSDYPIFDLNSSSGFYTQYPTFL